MTCPPANVFWGAKAPVVSLLVAFSLQVSSQKEVEPPDDRNTYDLKSERKEAPKETCLFLVSQQQSPGF